jgi:hypothetical protein
VLKKAKTQQYAMSEEEYLPGLIAIGAPLFDPITGKASARFPLIFQCSSTMPTRSGQIRGPDPGNSPETVRVTAAG